VRTAVARLRAALSWGSPWVFDASLALAFLVGGQVEASVSTTDGFTGGSVLASHLVAASVSWPLALRRTAPRACLLAVCLGVLVPSLLWAHDLYFWTELLPVLFAVYPVARHVEGAWGSWGWVAAFVSVDSVFLHSAGSREWSNVVFLAFMLVTTTLAGRLVRRGVTTSRRLAQALADLSAEHEAAERAAVREERARIDAEVRDVVAHAVGMMQVQIGAARIGLEVQGLEVPEQLRAAEDTGRRALAGLRSTAVLDGEEGRAPLEPLPDLAQLPDLVRGFRAAGLDVTVAPLDHQQQRELPAGLQLSAYRILQESLTNALRHGGRVRVGVVVRLEPDGEGELLVLEVTSDLGRSGRQTLPRGGHGLLGMRERVAMFDGRLRAGADSGRFVVRAELPVPRPEQTLTRAVEVAR
jgi:signal transduction histidine kinase